MKRTIIRGLILSFAIGLSACMKIIVESKDKIDEDEFIEFSDQAFLSALLRHADLDKNLDGRISMREASQREKPLDLSDAEIQDMNEIRFFENIRTLWCYHNRLTALDVSKNTALDDLNCSSNQLTTIDLSKNQLIRSINCDGNPLQKIILSRSNKLPSDFINKYKNIIKYVD